MTREPPIRVRVLSIAQATPDAGAARCRTLLTLEVAGAIRIDGVELHRDVSTGRAFLRFPAWIDAFGQRHSIVRPTTHEVRDTILQQVLAALDAGFPNPRPMESP